MKNRHRRLCPTRRARHYWFAPRNRPMINNPWINRCAVLVLLVMVYSIGYVSGKEEATFAHHCHPTLEP